MVPIHPGRILKRELAARGMSANRLALALRVPSGRITSILHGKRAISADTALRLAHHLGTNAQFWMNLQTATTSWSPSATMAQGSPPRSTTLRSARSPCDQGMLVE